MIEIKKLLIILMSCYFSSSNAQTVQNDKTIGVDGTYWERSPFDKNFYGIRDGYIFRTNPEGEVEIVAVLGKAAPGKVTVYSTAKVEKNRSTSAETPIIRCRYQRMQDNSEYNDTSVQKEFEATGTLIDALTESCSACSAEVKRWTRFGRRCRFDSCFDANTGRNVLTFLGAEQRNLLPQECR